MWLGEQITERGDRQRGVLDHIFRNCRPHAGAIADLVRLVRIEEFSCVQGSFLIALVVVVTGLVVWVETAQRKIPCSMPSACIGRRMSAPSGTYLPAEGGSVRRHRGPSSPYRFWPCP